MEVPECVTGESEPAVFFRFPGPVAGLHLFIALEGSAEGVVVFVSHGPCHPGDVHLLGQEFLGFFHAEAGDVVVEIHVGTLLERLGHAGDRHGKPAAHLF